MDFTSLVARASNAATHSPFNGVRPVSHLSRLNAVAGGNLRGENAGFPVYGVGNLHDGSQFEGDLGVGSIELDDSSGTSEQSGGEDYSSFWRRNADKKRSDALEDHRTFLSDKMIEDSGKQKKRKVVGDKNVDVRDEAATSPGVKGNPMEQLNVPKQDYIHVRARRGQATDSHSLAERARREKISERMKILQDLVPGCNKVIGKAMVLDEIINYIHALQHQVEFLSMKLEVVDSRMNTHAQAFQAKNFGNQGFEPSSVAFSSRTDRDGGQGPPQEWLHMQVGRGHDQASCYPK